MSKFFRCVCTLLAAAFTFVSMGLSVVNHVVYDESFYRKIIDDRYLESMHEYIEAAMIEDAEYYGIPAKFFTDYIDDEQIAVQSEKYYIGVYNALNGGELNQLDFADDKFKQGIEAFSATLDENSVMDKEAVELIAAEAAEIAQSTIKAVNDEYVLKAAEFTSNSRLKGLARNWYIFALLALVFVLAVYAIPNSKRFAKACLATSAVFIPSLAMMFFVLLLKGYDFKTKLALGDMPLKLFIDKVIDGTTGFALTISAAVALLSGVLFVVFMILRIKKSLAEK